MDLSISEAGSPGAGPLSDIIRRAFADVAARFGITAENCPKHPSNCLPEWTSSAMARRARYYVAKVDGQAVGCVALEKAGPAVCYLERLAVLPEWRRRGIGTMMVEHAAREAGRLGARSLQIGVIAQHVELVAWYRARGFRDVRRATFAHLPFEVLFMESEVEAPGDRAI